MEDLVHVTVAISFNIMQMVPLQVGAAQLHTHGEAKSGTHQDDLAVL